MAKAIGIGGIFLHFEGEEQQVMDWYEKHLGFDMTSYGTGFTDGTQYILLSFKRDNKPKTPFLNIRVDDIDTIIYHLKNLDLEIPQDIKEYEYGKFAQFIDPFGNAIELWQVYEENYVKMVQKEIENYKNKKEKP